MKTPIHPYLFRPSAKPSLPSPSFQSGHKNYKYKKVIMPMSKKFIISEKYAGSMSPI